MTNNHIRQGNVSVLISTFNRENYIKESIDSILNQTLPAREIIVVNDGSTDNTESILKLYGDKITVINQNNTGKAKAINLAFNHSHGDYIWIFDDDDVALEDFIETNTNILINNTNIDFTYGNYFQGKDSNDRKIVVTNDSKVPFVDNDHFLLKLLERCFLTTQGMLIRRKCINNNQVFNEKLVRSQDYELFIRLARNHLGGMSEKPAYIRRYHTGQRGSKADRFDSTKLEEKWYHYEKLAIEEFVKNADLHEYLPRSLQKHINNPKFKLQALAEKAVIMSRKGLWEVFAETIDELNKINNSNTYDKELYNICLAAFRKDLAVLELIKNNQYKNLLVSTMRQCIHPEVVDGMAKGIWHEKSQKDSCLNKFDRISAAQLGLQILGLAGIRRELRKNK